MKLTMAKRTKKKQIELTIEGPGVSAVCIPEVDDAAGAYIKIRDRRCLITPQEVAAKTALTDAIKSNKDKIGVNGDGEVVYRYDGQIVKLKPGKSKLSVRPENEEGEAEDDEA